MFHFTEQGRTFGVYGNTNNALDEVQTGFRLQFVKGKLGTLFGQSVIGKVQFTFCTQEVVMDLFFWGDHLNLMLLFFQIHAISFTVVT